MKVKWSLHAHEQRKSIIRLIAQEQSRETATRWNSDFRRAVSILPPYPELGDAVPEEAFFSLPPDYERLRQTHCLPYRIIYEHVDDEIHILAIMHSSMMVRSRDTYWN